MQVNRLIARLEELTRSATMSSSSVSSSLARAESSHRTSMGASDHCFLFPH